MTLKVLFVSESDPRDKKSWSGTLNTMFEKLNNKYDVEIFVSQNKKINLYQKMRSKLSKLILKQSIPAMNKKIALKKSKNFDKNLKSFKNIDIIFAPASSSSIAFSKTKIPIIYLSDATFHLLDNYYIFGLNDKYISEGNEIELQVLRKSTQIIHASDWASNDAKEFYGISKNKLNRILFGANISNDYLPKKIENIMHLLFIGVNWERKGAQIAIDTFHELKRRGLNCSLTMIGILNNQNQENQDVTFLGFIDKNTKDGMTRIKAEYAKATFFVLPTKAECAGIVFCEASSYGIPTISFDTGGVKEYVLNNKSGTCLPPNANYMDFSDEIERLSEKSRYERYSKNAREFYENELNWEVWLEKFLHFM